MVLPAPNLDDRDFQDLVDDAKRLVQQRCPEWTDHNVSDPGVTLIEAFAQMVDQLIYRLNRVPGPALRQVPRADRPAALPGDRRARHGDVLARRRRSRRRSLVRAETEVATPRTEVDEPVVFSTVADLPIVPCEFSDFAAVDGRRRDHRPHPAAGASGGRRRRLLGRPGGRRRRC